MRNLESSNGSSRLSGKSDKELQRLARKFDFDKNTYASNKVIRLIENLFKKYVRSLENSLSVFLETEVQVKINSISKIKYLDYLLEFQLQSTWNYMFIIDPVGEPVHVHIDNQLFFTCIDIGCGGKVNNGFIDREFTDIEKKLLDTMIKYFLNPFRESLIEYFENDYRQVNQEEELFREKSLRDYENIHVAQLKVSLNEQYEYFVNFIIPATTLESMIKIAKGSQQNGRETKSVGVLEMQLKLTTLELDVILGGAKLEISQIEKLKLGDIIKLNRKLEDNLPVMMKNQILCYVQPGTYQQNKIAVQVIDLNPSFEEEDVI